MSGFFKESYGGRLYDALYSDFFAASDGIWHLIPKNPLAQIGDICVAKDQGGGGAGCREKTPDQAQTVDGLTTGQYLYA